MENLINRLLEEAQDNPDDDRWIAANALERLADELAATRQELASAHADIERKVGEWNSEVAAHEATRRKLAEAEALIMRYGPMFDRIGYVGAKAELAKELQEIRTSNGPAALTALLAEAEARTVQYVTALWGIIDDIDSYGDMAKSDDSAFRKLTEKRQKDRWNTGITCDGYALTIPNTEAITALLAAEREKVIDELFRLGVPIGEFADHIKELK